MTTAYPLLVEAGWLASRVDDPGIRIVDIRGIVKPVDQPKPHYLACRADYTKDHIPGAAFVDWLEDIVQPEHPVPMSVASPERFAALMARLGIGDEHHIVVYDCDGGQPACRLWWALNYYGHPAVSVLNGGYPKWAAEGHPVTSEAPNHPSATFTPSPQSAWRATMEDARKAMQDAATVLVDTRPPIQFTGAQTRGQRKGRIPGAVNVPIARFLQGPHKTFRSPEEIRQVLDAAGATRDKRVIAYCNAGVSASVGLFALRLAGHPNATNFAGSWYEWERDPANPIAAG